LSTHILLYRMQPATLEQALKLGLLES